MAAFKEIDSRAVASAFAQIDRASSLMMKSLTYLREWRKHSVSIVQAQNTRQKYSK